MEKPVKTRSCVSLKCEKALKGSERLYCSNACKQAVKYAEARGRQCKACHKDIKKPVPVIGGYSNVCQRKRCIKERS